MAEEKKLPEPSETVKKLRETFAPLTEELQPEDEPALIYERVSETDE
jgi:hypothetical protein